MAASRKSPKIETAHHVFRRGAAEDLAALIGADPSSLNRLENNPELNQQDSALMELKRTIRSRITAWRSKLVAEVSAEEDELQVAYNCLFLSE